MLEEEDLPLNDLERSSLVETLSEEALGIVRWSTDGGPHLTSWSTDRSRSTSTRVPESTSIVFQDDEHVIRVIERIAARANRRIDTAQPMADLRLPDGSRVNATLPPVSPDGPTLSIRRFGRQRIRAIELERTGAMSTSMREFLHTVVEHRQCVLVSGGTGAGKSTLLGALAEAIPMTERVVTIEDTLELQLDQEHVVRLETRPPNVENTGTITQRELVVNALRMRPDRIILGEADPGRLGHAPAMNTGHEGSLSTIHANSPRCARAARDPVPWRAGASQPGFREHRLCRRPRARRAGAGWPPHHPYRRDHGSRRRRRSSKTSIG